MSHFFLRSKHYVLFVPLFLTTLTTWIFQGMYSQSIQEWSTEAQMGGDFDFSGFDLADYNVYFYAFIGVMLLSLLTQVGWYRSVGQDLKRYLPDHLDLQDKTFKVTIPLQVITTFAIIAIYWYGWNWASDNLTALIDNEGIGSGTPQDFLMTMLKFLGMFSLVGIIGFAATIYNCYFAGKTLKSIEEGRPVKGGEVVGYVILSYFLVVGVWIMQPKINRLVETGSMDKAEDNEAW
ncbi:hypothetical protein FUA23_12820 [Neolewinella aurantiaca]|uniref:Uncharacterized protein n=1 Tax=Neolewinella aurantiaca TaxID=2602767 RepID=A0A5C7FN67_9BACT|nr:hypothetical protein [Neolewinella aurantiaca]TXF88934.1 hypothetical protein FUA23_12820 [Neolewinella aurantiaca]